MVTPLLGAAIGYFTNCLAIGMLFRPHREKRIAGIRLPFTPGLFPKERERLAKKIAETVSEFLLTPEMLAKELTSSSPWQGMRDITVEELLTSLGVNTDESEEWIQKGLTSLRGYLFAEGVTVGDRIPEAFTDMLKKSAEDILPKAVDYIRQWPEENPWLDEKLSAMVRKIIDENFGRLIGMFIDHQKIYTHIKDGLFEYLSDPENQRFMSAQIGAAVDRLRAEEFSAFEGRLPKDAYFIEQINAWAAKGTAKLTGKGTATLAGESGAGLPEEDVAQVKPEGDNATPTDADLPPNDREMLLYNEALSTIEAKIMPDVAESLSGDSNTEADSAAISSVNAAAEPGDAPPSSWYPQIGSLTLGELSDFFTHDKEATDIKDSRLWHLFEQMAAYIAKHIPIRKMIEDKLNAFSVAEVETLILSVVQRELRVIMSLGGLLGFLIGLLSVIPQLISR